MSSADIILIVLCVLSGSVVAALVILCLWYRSWTWLPWLKRQTSAHSFLFQSHGGRSSSEDGRVSSEDLTGGSHSQELLQCPRRAASSYRTFSPTQLLSPRRSQFGSGGSLTPTSSSEWSPYSAKTRAGAARPTSVADKKPFLTGRYRQSSECLLLINPVPESVSRGAVDYLRRRRASSFTDLHCRSAGGKSKSETARALEELGLDLSLYPTEPDPEAQHETLLGRLCLKLELLPKKSTLLVTVSRARYLLRRRPSNMCTFYVALSYTRPGGNREKRKTQLVSAACNPQFDRQFVLPCAREEALDSELLFKVKETAPTVGKPHVIGHCALQVATLLGMGPGAHEIWRELQPAAALDADNESQKPPAKIFLSLSYNQSKKLLTLGIVEGKDLRVKETDAYVYFRASVMAREQTVKAKKTPLIKENLACPTVQQEFRFHLAPNLTDQVYLFVLICARSRLGANRLLGKAVIGSANFAQGSGLEQWTDCFRNQPSIVHQWHDIY